MPPLYDPFLFGSVFRTIRGDKDTSGSVTGGQPGDPFQIHVEGLAMIALEVLEKHGVVCAADSEKRFEIVEFGIPEIEHRHLRHPAEHLEDVRAVTAVMQKSFAEYRQRAGDPRNTKAFHHLRREERGAVFRYPRAAVGKPNSPGHAVPVEHRRAGFSDQLFEHPGCLDKDLSAKVEDTLGRIFVVHHQRKNFAPEEQVRKVVCAFNHRARKVGTEGHPIHLPKHPGFCILLQQLCPTLLKYFPGR